MEYFATCTFYSILNSLEGRGYVLVFVNEGLRVHSAEMARHGKRWRMDMDRRTDTVTMWERVASSSGGKIWRNHLTAQGMVEFLRNVT